MKVAIDSGPLKGGDAVRGLGTYTRELLKHLQDLESNTFSVAAVDLRNVEKSAFDIVHYPTFNPYFISLPLKKQTKTVVTIHDTIPLLYPKYYPPGIRGLFKLLINKQILKTIDSVITVSETSKKDIVRFLDVDESKINVIYEAAGSEYFAIKERRKISSIKTKYHLPEKFVLYVGDVNYNKNLNILAEGCLIAGIPLVIAGKQAVAENINRDHPENRSFIEFLRNYKNNPLIVRLGFVPDSDMAAIYSSASVYCQPSLYEGFGLPILEAMKCETPVIISRTQALVEIAGDAALIFNPRNAADLAEKIRIISNNKQRQAFIHKGLKRVKQYSWELTAEKTLNVYKSL